MKEENFMNVLLRTMTIFLVVLSSLLGANLAQAKVSADGIAETSELVRPLLPGQMVADVCLQDAEKRKVCTGELFAEKPTVLIVYRGGWCPYCNSQLNQIKAVEQGIQQLGYQIVAVSPDSNKNVAEQREREKINYSLLADTELNLSKELGLAFFLDKKTEAKYRDRLGVPFVGLDGDSRVALPVPAIYIIDKKGMVHFNYVNPDYRVRLNEKLLLSAARLLRSDVN